MQNSSILIQKFINLNANRYLISLPLQNFAIDIPPSALLIPPLRQSDNEPALSEPDGPENRTVMRKFLHAAP